MVSINTFHNFKFYLLNFIIVFIEIDNSSPMKAETSGAVSTSYDNSVENNDETNPDLVKHENNDSVASSTIENMETNDEDSDNFENKELTMNTNDEPPIQYTLVHSNLQTTTQNSDITTTSSKLNVDQMILSDQSIGSSTENLVTNNEENVN